MNQRFRESTTRNRLCIFFLIGLTLAQCQSQPLKKYPSFQDGSQKTERSFRGLTISSLKEAVVAIEAELLETGRCRGGEEIEIWLRGSGQVEQENVLECVYVVPGVLAFYRLGYVEPDGLVILDSDLSFAEMENRYSAHKLHPFDIAERHLYPVQIFARIGERLSDHERERQREREKRKADWLKLP